MEQICGVALERATDLPYSGAMNGWDKENSPGMVLPHRSEAGSGSERPHARGCVAPRKGELVSPLLGRIGQFSYSFKASDQMRPHATSHALLPLGPSVYSFSLRQNRACDGLLALLRLVGPVAPHDET